MGSSISKGSEVRAIFIFGVRLSGDGNISESEFFMLFFTKTHQNDFKWKCAQKTHI